jgi:hypothetical protein
MFKKIISKLIDREKGGDLNGFTGPNNITSSDTYGDAVGIHTRSIVVMNPT